MKKALIGAALATLMAGSAFAAGQSNTGCGLGSVLFQGKMDTVAIQVLAVTTNGTFGNQTFGITSGTLNCAAPSKAAQNDKLNHFVKANMDSLAADIAQGRGESLDTFVELMGVPTENRAAFKAALQKDFSRIYAGSDVVMANVIDGAATVAN